MGKKIVKTEKASELPGWESWHARFQEVKGQCERTHDQIVECKTLVAQCRVADDVGKEKLGQHYALAIIALGNRMREYGFPAVYTDLDDMEKCLEAIESGCRKLTGEVESALEAVKRMPFASKFLTGDLSGLEDEIGRIVKAAHREWATYKPGEVQTEIIICRMVCDVERVSEQWAAKNARSQINAKGQTVTNDEIMGMMMEMRDNGINVSSFTGEAKDRINELHTDIISVGDDVNETVRELGGEHIPPEPKDVDDISRRKLYCLIKNLDKKKRGYLDTFLTKSSWTFRGFNAREIYRDADGLRKFINTERMAISREQNDKK